MTNAWLIQLYNLCSATQTTPKKLLQACVTALLKRGKNASEPNPIKPMSLIYNFKDKALK